MAKTQTLAEWEMQLYMFAPDGKPSSKKKYTEDAFREYALENRFLVVDKEYRHKWLEDAGHEITRSNLIDLSLEPKVKE